MALITVKPTSNGRRSVIKLVNPDLHKGQPFAALVESQSKRAGRIFCSYWLRSMSS